MKVSDLKIILDTLPEGSDPEIVTGEVWLPERLIDTQLDNELLHLQFDSAPDDFIREEEGRGFVEHEINLLHSKVMKILHEPAAVADKAQALLGLILMAHEQSSSQVIEAIEDLEDNH
ncbi:hypothetical protein GT360_08835 [Vibrio astriarenae]|uniref:Uncharacterized protein n=1 Tax=Vibrio astriarenae TaxID=1481923 RepID=A0A7Z2T3C3_9VIBR|nr:hypothetical protein [Vibrio astriarenae]QIA63614.1 hypothetical protein GT360_08835 [Vibrio astriarenae]